PASQSLVRPPTDGAARPLLHLADLAIHLSPGGQGGLPGGAQFLRGQPDRLGGREGWARALDFLTHRTLPPPSPSPGRRGLFRVQRSATSAVLRRRPLGRNR